MFTFLICSALRVGWHYFNYYDGAHRQKRISDSLSRLVAAICGRALNQRLRNSLVQISGCQPGLTLMTAELIIDSYELGVFVKRLFEFFDQCGEETCGFTAGGNPVVKG